MGLCESSGCWVVCMTPGKRLVCAGDYDIYTSETDKQPLVLCSGKFLVNISNGMET